MISVELIAFTLFVSLTSALDNGLGLTPQMGWNTWNSFRCKINEQLIKETADRMVELGLDQLGYKYLNLDDCWQDFKRDNQGRIQIDKRNFPSGMLNLGEYIHGKGLLFGLYSSSGDKTCEGRAGSLNYETVDAQDYASWGVDYLKYDSCFNQGVPAIKRYSDMRDALKKTGRPIFYSICNQGRDGDPSWAAEVGNSWRTTEDIEKSFSTMFANFFNNSRGQRFAGPGAWNDPDMLEVGVHDGNGVYGYTIEEEKTHFALWAIMKAPLIIGADLRDIRPESLAILKNKELIGINQDNFGLQGKCFGVEGCYGVVQSYYMPLQDGGRAVVVTNWDTKAYSNFVFTMTDLGITLAKDKLRAIVTDCFDTTFKMVLTSDSQPFAVGNLESHQSRALKIILEHDDTK